MCQEHHDKEREESKIKKNIEVEEGKFVEDLTEESAYKYLGIEGWNTRT